MGTIWIHTSDQRHPAPRELIGPICDNFTRYGRASCLQVYHANAKLNVVMWGDSHSVALRKDARIQDHVNFTSVGHPDCAPLLGMFRFDDTDNASNCDNSKVMSGYADYCNRC